MKIVQINTVTGERTEFDDGRPQPVAQFPCPCCHFITLAEKGGYEICPVCFWEDDGQGDSDADEVRGGPNGDLSLTEARKNFVRLGACEEAMVQNVRAPNASEFPPDLQAHAEPASSPLE